MNRSIRPRDLPLESQPSLTETRVVRCHTTSLTWCEAEASLPCALPIWQPGFVQSRHVLACRCCLVARADAICFAQISAVSLSLTPSRETDSPSPGNRHARFRRAQASYKISRTAPDVTTGFRPRLSVARDALVITLRLWRKLRFVYFVVCMVCCRPHCAGQLPELPDRSLLFSGSCLYLYYKHVCQIQSAI